MPSETQRWRSGSGLPDRRTWVDEQGEPLYLPPGEGRHATYIGDRLAVVVHELDLVDQPALLESAGSAARLALENARLQAELRAQLVELRESRARIVHAGDEERRRLERDLHDGAQQRLLALGMGLQLLRGHVDPSAEELLDENERELQAALRELRELAQGIHPAVLTDNGLGDAVRTLAQRAPVPVNVEIDESIGRLPTTSRPPPTSSSPKHSRTSRSTPTPPRPGSASAARTATPSSPSGTTAGAGPSQPAEPGYVASATASAHSTGSSRSKAHPETAPASSPRSRSSRKRRFRRAMLVANRDYDSDDDDDDEDSRLAFRSSRIGSPRCWRLWSLMSSYAGRASLTSCRCSSSDLFVNACLTEARGIALPRCTERARSQERRRWTLRTISAGCSVPARSRTAPVGRRAKICKRSGQ